MLGKKMVIAIAAEMTMSANLTSETTGGPFGRRRVVAINAIQPAALHSARMRPATNAQYLNCSSFIPMKKYSADTSRPRAKADPGNPLRNQFNAAAIMPTRPDAMNRAATTLIPRVSGNPRQR